MQKKVLKNVSISLIAQVISLVTSFIVGFIVPKFIDMEQYSLWQVFVLYLGYVGVFHFGLLDGLILRYSEYDYDQLDKNKIRGQFRMILIISLVFCLLFIGASNFFVDKDYRYVVILLGVAICSKNIFTYTSYTFQMTNRINKYAFLVILQRMIYAFFIVILLVLKVNNFIFYCIADIFADIVCNFIMSFFNKGMYLGKIDNFSLTISETKKNISAGILLLIANFTSMFIIGSSKMIIQFRWDDLMFGKTSFSFSVSNIFLTFVAAISIVLFPSLKRMNQEQLPDMYKKIRDGISPVLFLSLLLYFPGCYILSKWLPKYIESLSFLAILLPIIVFDSKVGLLTNNYLKAYRQEKRMLFINLICISIGIILFAISAFIFSSIDAILISIVAIVIIRSIISEIVVLKLINKKISLDYVYEIIMTILFIIAARWLSLLYGFIAYSICLVIYMIIYRKSIFELINKILKLNKKEEC